MHPTGNQMSAFSIREQPSLSSSGPSYRIPFYQPPGLVLVSTPITKASQAKHVGTVIVTTGTTALLCYYDQTRKLVQASLGDQIISRFIAEFEF